MLYFKHWKISVQITDERIQFLTYWSQAQMQGIKTCV